MQRDTFRHIIQKMLKDKENESQGTTDLKVNYTKHYAFSGIVGPITNRNAVYLVTTA